MLILFSVPGAADEASAVFGEAAVLCVQKQYQNYGLTSQNLNVPSEDRNLVSGRNYGVEDASPKQMKNMLSNNMKDIPGNHHSSTVMGGATGHPLSGSSSNMSFYTTPSPMGSHV